ncbi:MAG: DUF92 domain-containing protein, partial [Thermoanaerobaculia bacterium]
MPAWRLGALTLSGALAATLVGAIVLASAGLGPAAVLVFFFVSASLLSALPGKRERSRRDARQVIANGSIAALAAAVTVSQPVASLAFLGALAAATADTWATEIGLRLGRRPRSILTLRSRPPGSSGAISIPGTVASAAGALAIGLVGGWWMGGIDRATLSAIAAAGFLGSVTDSLLGDGLQAVYRCPECGAAPEVARHSGCEVRARRVSGIPGLDNDLVNW